MNPEEIKKFNQLVLEFNNTNKKLNDFLSLYYRTHLIDKWVLTYPLVLHNSSIEIEGQNGLQIGKNNTDKLSFYGVSTTAQPSALTAQLTDLTHTAPSTPDYAIQDLTNVGSYGFATKDEGNTVLSVIKNLQTRVQELEDKLQSLGLIA